MASFQNTENDVCLSLLGSDLDNRFSTVFPFDIEYTNLFEALGDYPINNTIDPSNYDSEWGELFKCSTVSAVSYPSKEGNLCTSSPFSPLTTFASPDTSSTTHNSVSEFDSPVSHSAYTTPQCYTEQHPEISSILDNVLSIPVPTISAPVSLEPERHQHQTPIGHRAPISGSQIAVPSQLPRRRRPGRPRKEDLHIVDVTADRQIHNNSATRSRARFSAIFDNLWSLVPEELQSRAGSETTRKEASRAQKGLIVLEYLRELQGKAVCN